MKILLGLALLLVAVLPAYWVFRRTSLLGRASRRLALSAAGAGFAAGVLTLWVERALLAFTQLSFEVKAGGLGSALLATFFLAAPLEEAAKTLVVWPLYRTRRIDAPRLGLSYAVAAAAGFALGEAATELWAAKLSLVLGLRMLCQVPAHLFFAGVWGYALGSRRGRGRWFSLSWFGAVLLHGLYDHIVWGRGPGFLVAVLPLLGFMALGLLTLREVAPDTIPIQLARRIRRPRLSLVQEAFSVKEHPLMLRWVVLGAFINLGLMLVLLAAAVLLGHRLGVDFQAADESDVRSAGPLLFLGSALLSAFPLAGYLIARASASPGVLESALSAACALSAVVAVLGLVAPLGVLFTLAVAPLAFGLACGGAWIGMDR